MQTTPLSPFAPPRSSQRQGHIDIILNSQKRVSIKRPEDLNGFVQDGTLASWLPPWLVYRPNTALPVLDKTAEVPTPLVDFPPIESLPSYLRLKSGMTLPDDPKKIDRMIKNGSILELLEDISPDPPNKRKINKALKAVTDPFKEQVANIAQALAPFASEEHGERWHIYFDRERLIEPVAYLNRMDGMLPNHQFTLTMDENGQPLPLHGSDKEGSTKGQQSIQSGFLFQVRDLHPTPNGYKTVKSWKDYVRQLPSDEKAKIALTYFRVGETIEDALNAYAYHMSLNDPKMRQMIILNPIVEGGVSIQFKKRGENLEEWAERPKDEVALKAFEENLPKLVKAAYDVQPSTPRNGSDKTKQERHAKKRKGDEMPSIEPPADIDNLTNPVLRTVDDYMQRAKQFLANQKGK
jgi:hypothetical protein